MSEHSQQLTLDDINYINEKLSNLPFDGSLIDKFNKLLSQHQPSSDVRLINSFGKFIHDDTIITYYHLKSSFANVYAITPFGVNYSDKGFNYVIPLSVKYKEQLLSHGYKEDGDYVYTPWTDKVEFEIERVPFNLKVFLEILRLSVYELIKWDGNDKIAHRYFRIDQGVEICLPTENYELCENDKRCIKGMHDFMMKLRRLKENNYRAYIEEECR